MTAVSKNSPSNSILLGGGGLLFSRYIQPDPEDRGGYPLSTSALENKSKITGKLVKLGAKSNEKNLSKDNDNTEDYDKYKDQTPVKIYTPENCPRIILP